MHTILKSLALVALTATAVTAQAADAVTVDPKIPENWEKMWRNTQRGHAGANCVYIAAANRVGNEGSTHFFGGSFIADPNTTFLAKADDSEQIAVFREARSGDFIG